MRTGIQTQTTKTTIELTGRLTLKIRFAVAAVAGCLLVVPLTGTHKHFSDEWGKVSGVSPFFTSQPRKTKGSDPLNLTQELLGHRDVKTTMIYTHILHRGPAGVRSPLDGM